MSTSKTAGLALALGLVATTAAGLDTITLSEPPSLDVAGMVQLALLGEAELSPEGGGPIAALHVRATITNPTPRWLVLDVSKARVEAPGRAPARPIFVNADVPTLPIAILCCGERQVIDFYFPVAGSNELELSWQMNDPPGVSVHEQLLRIRNESRVILREHWWFDPRYGWSTYFRGPGIATPRPPKYVVTVRAIDERVSDERTELRCEQ